MFSWRSFCLVDHVINTFSQSELLYDRPRIAYIGNNNMAKGSETVWKAELIFVYGISYTAFLNCKEAEMVMEKIENTFMNLSRQN